MRRRVKQEEARPRRRLLEHFEERVLRVWRHIGHNYQKDPSLAKGAYICTLAQRSRVIDAEFCVCSDERVWISSNTRAVALKDRDKHFEVGLGAVYEEKVAAELHRA